MKGRITTLLCTALLTTTNVQAAMPVPYGWYFQGNIGRSSIHNTILPGDLKNTGLGWGLTLGYKFTTYFAGDFDITNYAKLRMYNAFQTKVATTQYYSYDLAGKLLMPIGTTGAEVFGKAGIGRVHSWTHRQDVPASAFTGMNFYSGTRSKNAVVYGAGIDYAITHQLLVDIQWMRAQTSRTLGKSDLLSGGIAYII